MRGRAELGAVWAGGCLGALARAATAERFPHAADSWPWPTFAVNLLGTLILAAAIVAVRGQPQSRRRLAFVGAGFCGALTTFATLQLELVRMLEADAYQLAAAYAVISIAAGMACVVLVVRTAPRLRRS